MRLRFFSIPLIVLLLAATGCREGVRQQGPTAIEPGFNLLTPQQDVEIGRHSAEIIKRELPLVREPAITTYVASIGERLARHAPGESFPYRFYVANVSDQNAIALPGGVIFVTRGVLENVSSEDELAGVLAHEIAHIAYRHGTHNLSKAYLSRSGAGLVGGLVGSDFGLPTANIINVFGGYGMNALFLRYNRTAERQADLGGAQIMADAGYDPNQMLAYLEMLEKDGGDEHAGGWLSSHPSPEQRIDRLRQELLHLTVAAGKPRQAQHFAAMRQALKGLPPARSIEMYLEAEPAEPAAQRAAAAPVPLLPVEPPSMEMHGYSNRSGLFSLSHPANWRAYEAGGTAVTLAPPGGVKKIDGRAELRYGAVIGHYAPIGEETINRWIETRSLSLEDATRDLVEELTASRSHLTLGEASLRTLDVNGREATMAVLNGTSPATGDNERITVVTQQLADRHIVFLLFVTPESEAERYSGVLAQMIASLHVQPNAAH
jgi:beta-barrel assembly-enhancing protease